MERKIASKTIGNYKVDHCLMPPTHRFVRVIARIAGIRGLRAFVLLLPEKL